MIEPSSLLSSSVLAEITRLGGKWLSVAAAAGDCRLDGHAIAPSMFAFSTRIEWPNVTFETPEDSSLWVWLVRFSIAGWLSPNEITIADRDHRELFYFAQTDGGNYLLLFDAADPDPTDPKVYRISHSDPEQQLNDGTPLSEFLHDLVAEQN